MPISSGAESAAVVSSAGVQSAREMRLIKLRARSKTEHLWYWCVLVAYVCVLAMLIPRHEPWGDEAQSWMMAKDLGWWDLIFYKLRLEGTPGLWVSVLYPFAHFGAPYSCMNWIGAACATAGTAVLLWLSPFPRYVKLLLPFSFFLLYQYAVVARSYTMFLLLAGLAAYFFRNKVRGLVGLTISCSLLALLSAHGFLVGAAIFFVYAGRNFWPLSRNREYLPRFIASTSAFTAVLLFAAVTSRSPHAFYLSPFPSAWYRTQPTFAFMLAGTNLGEASANGLTGEVASSLLVLTVFWTWAARRNRLLEFSPLVLLLAFLATVYCWPHHTGLIFLTSVICAWMAWPQEWERTSHADKLVKAVLVTVCSVQIAWAAVAALNDYRQPYTGAREAADFIRSLPRNSKIFGYGMANVAVQAYLPESPFANYDRKLRYWSHDVSNPIDREYTRIEKERPDYILNSGIAEKDIGMLAVHEFARQGYVKTHTFCGDLFFQFSSYQASCYAVYEPRTKQADFAKAALVPSATR